MTSVERPTSNTAVEDATMIMSLAIEIAIYSKTIDEARARLEQLVGTPGFSVQTLLYMHKNIGQKSHEIHGDHDHAVLFNKTGASRGEGPLAVITKTPAHSSENLKFHSHPGDSVEFIVTASPGLELVTQINGTLCSTPLPPGRVFTVPQEVLHTIINRGSSDVYSMDIRVELGE